MSHRQFSERLNKELDNMGVPHLSNERVEIFAKLVKVRPYKAQQLLNGITLPDPQLLSTLAQELDVNSDWLLGRSEHRHGESN